MNCCSMITGQNHGASKCSMEFAVSRWACRDLLEILASADLASDGSASVVEGEDVLTLHPEERGSQKLFVDTSRIPKEKWGPPLMQEDWVALCQALYQSIRRKSGQKRANN